MGMVRGVKINIHNNNNKLVTYRRKSENINKYAKVEDEVTRIWQQGKLYVAPIGLFVIRIISNHLPQISND